jgi:hypothetical protein
MDWRLIPMEICTFPTNTIIGLEKLLVTVKFIILRVTANRGLKTEGMKAMMD